MQAFCSSFSAHPRGVALSRGALCELYRSAFAGHGVYIPRLRGACAGMVVMQADGKEEGASLGLRIFAGAVAAGLIATSLGPVYSGLRTALNGSEAGSAIIVDKLHKVPLFAVTDETGRPFLVESADGKRRVGYFFVAPSDAEDFLARVREDTPSSEASLARVRAVGLDEALPFITRKPRAGSGIPEIFELVPDAGETDIARTMTGGNFEKVFGKGVPLFFVDSLALQGAPDGKPVIPLFFEKEKLDEFLQKAKENGSGNIVKPEDIQVVELLQTIREMKEGANERLKQIVLFPMKKAENFFYENQ